MADAAESTPFTDPATAISQGKRHLLVRDYTAAVTAFAEGLELLSQKHGEYGDELGEPYLLYGRALLGLAREEAGVLGGGVPGGDEDDEDDEDDEVDDEKLSNVDEKDENDAEIDDKVPNKDTTEDGENVDVGDAKEASETKNDEANKTDDNKVEEKKIDEIKVNDKDANEKAEKIEEIDSAPGTSKDNTKENGECSGEKNGNTVQNGDNDGEDINKEEDEEDPGRGIDLQVAWEVLELAKIVFYKRGQAGYKQLAEAHRLLGEVAMESGNHQVAVSDLEKALKILQNVEPYEPRAMAELHYHLGLAHSLGNDFDASIEQFNEATNLLETRIKELENTKEPAKSDDPFYTIEGEITELKELLPEIKEKIADMKDFKEEACRLVIEGIKSKVASGSCTNGAGPSNDDGASSSGTSSASPKVPAKPASDISHLVRKKRKNDENEPESASPCKKPTP